MTSWSYKDNVDILMEAKNTNKWINNKKKTKEKINIKDIFKQDLLKEALEIRKGLRNRVRAKIVL